VTQLSQPYRERDLEVDGLRLRIAEAGVGGRPILLVHGFTGAKEDFVEWLAPLAERGWHAVAPDLRGHGASDKPAEEAAYSFEHFAVDLLGLLDELGWDTAVLLGHSMGGMAVQTALLKAPERVAAVVLMDTSDGPLRSLDPDLIDLAVTILRTEGMQALMDAQAALAEDAPIVTPANRRLLEERPGYAEFGDAKMLASSPVMYAAMAPRFADEVANPDRLPALAQLRLPALVIVGEQDEPFLEASHRMAAAIPGAVLEVIADGGHSPQFEAPDAWWAALTRFLDRLPT
jgi:pimeloyl-ACP methyl ester carboxylesterase